MRLSIVLLGIVVMFAAVLVPPATDLGPVLIVAGLVIIAVGAIAPSPATVSSSCGDDQLETEEEILFVHGEDD